MEIELKHVKRSDLPPYLNLGEVVTQRRRKAEGDPDRRKRIKRDANGAEPSSPSEKRPSSIPPEVLAADNSSPSLLEPPIPPSPFSAVPQPVPAVPQPVPAPTLVPLKTEVSLRGSFCFFWSDPDHTPTRPFKQLPPQAEADPVSSSKEATSSPKREEYQELDPTTPLHESVTEVREPKKLDIKLKLVCPLSFLFLAFRNLISSLFLPPFFFLHTGSEYGGPVR